MGDDGDAIQREGVQHGGDCFHRELPKIDAMVVHPLTPTPAWPVKSDDVAALEFGQQRREGEHIPGVAWNDQDGFPGADLTDTNPDTGTGQMEEVVFSFQTIEIEQMLFRLKG